MSRYRLLADHSVNGLFLEAGSVQTTQDVSSNGNLPADWVPSGNCEPLDAAAVNDFWNAGPQDLQLVRTPILREVAASPVVTFWVQVRGGNTWRLTGLGADKPAVMRLKAEGT
jgi:hypothetical protein